MKDVGRFPMPPVMDDAPMTAADIREAITNLNGSAKIAARAGDKDRHEKRHEQINALIDQLTSSALVPA